MQLNWLDKETSKLSDGFPDRMVLLDCETTGGNATYNRVIEIGLLIIDDGNLVKRWQSFIDPQTSLPPFIQKITGIEPGMLIGAPLFKDIAEELLELLKDRVLVAHNARFDYGFLKNEFARAGIKYSTKPLCSVKFSRSLYPQFNRHGLSHIIKRFDLIIENRHRAMDDAEMIYHFFLKSSTLFSDEEIASNCKQQLKRPSLPMNLASDEVDKLPSSAGVYYFYDSIGTLLYVGKSVNIRNRVMSHFTQDHKNPKDLKMSSKIAHVDFKTTPSDFGAQILESHEIKALNPLYNRRLRKIKKMYQFVSHQNSEGYNCLSVEAIDVTSGGQDSSIGLFRSLRQANKKLESIADAFSLCHRLLGLESQSKSSQCRACFRTQLGKCFGACNGTESRELYNQRIKNALEGYELQIWPYPGPILIEEKNPNGPDLTGLHVIDQWRYITKVHCSADLSELGFRVVNGVLNSTEKKSESFPDVNFDLDIYFILVRFLINEKKMAMNNIKTWQLIYQTKEEY
jgi:DNA polymerase-3 subunit epsilon